jgi:hypothetical protein
VSPAAKLPPRAGAEAAAAAEAEAEVVETLVVVAAPTADRHVRR